MQSYCLSSQLKFVDYRALLADFAKLCRLVLKFVSGGHCKYMAKVK